VRCDGVCEPVGLLPGDSSRCVKILKVLLCRMNPKKTQQFVIAKFSIGHWKSMGNFRQFIAVKIYTAPKAPIILLINFVRFRKNSVIFEDFWCVGVVIDFER
jgi:hypothetical protein